MATGARSLETWAGGHGESPRSVAAEFAARWNQAVQSGTEPPTVEAMIPADGPDRSALVLELISVDAAYRSRVGVSVHLDDYLQRFPELATPLCSALSQWGSASLASSCPLPALSRADGVPEPQLADVLATASRRQTQNAEALRLDPSHSARTNPCGTTRLGKFSLLRPLGEGAFGTVYLAHDDELDRMVAVKMPRRGRFLNQAEEDRFLREARSGAQLCHPGIVPVYEVGREGSLVYIVSECVEGQTLDTALESRKFSFRESAALVAEVALALEHAHHRGVVHRDLKPSNIMLQRPAGASDASVVESSARTLDSLCDGKSQAGVAAELLSTGRPRLMDFGLARRVEAEDSVTIDGELLGTPAYMSPEQARGEAYLVDGRSDVYSLGVILYQLLAGDLPFRGNLRMLLEQVLTEEPRSPRRLNDRVPRDLETIALKCLAKEPGRRYQTAADLAAELHRFLAGRPIEARPVSSAERLWRWCRRNRVVAGMTALAVCAVLFGLLATSVGYVRTSSALEDTRKAQAESQESLQEARQAVHDLFTRVSQESLLNQPGMQPLRRDLLRRAQDYYQRFLDRYGERAGLDDELALTHFRVGLIAEQLEPEKAISEHQKALALQERLLADDPQNDALLGPLGDTLTALGRCYERGKMLAQSLAACREAARIRETLAGMRPDDVEAHRTWANSCMNLAILEEAEDRNTSRRHYQKAQEIRRQILQKHPGNIKVQRDLALGCYGLANAAQRAGSLAEAEGNAKEAIRWFESVCRAEPKDLACRSLLGLSQRLLADITSVHGGGDATLALYGRARAVMEKLARENPAVVDYQVNLAEIDLNRGQKLGELARYDLALVAFEQAAATLEPLAAAHPESERFRLHYLKALQATAELQNHTNRRMEALATLKKLQGYLEQVLKSAPRSDEMAVHLERTRAAVQKLEAR